jgi:DNA anti-recombination protein RmuC
MDVLLIGMNVKVPVLVQMRLLLFKTLAIQKRSGEVWKVLGSVKTEFEKFGGLIEKAQGNIQNGLKQLDEVVGARTRAIQRQLRDVEVLNDTPNALNALENPELPVD